MSDSIAEGYAKSTPRIAAERAERIDRDLAANFASDARMEALISLRDSDPAEFKSIAHGATRTSLAYYEQAKRVDDKINPGAAAYHYEQLAKIIEGKIRSGEYPAGSRLPGEMILAQEFGVGSNTVRRALGILRDAGLVVTVRARGTFVSDPLPN